MSERVIGLASVREVRKFIVDLGEGLKKGYSDEGVCGMMGITLEELSDIFYSVNIVHQDRRVRNELSEGDSEFDRRVELLDKLSDVVIGMQQLGDKEVLIDDLSDICLWDHERGVVSFRV
jgi:hypothetical protein